MNHDDLSFGAPEPLTTGQAAEMRPEVAHDDVIYQALSELAGLDVSDTNLRDHPEAWIVIEMLANHCYAEGRKDQAAFAAAPQPRGVATEPVLTADAAVGHLRGALYDMRAIKRDADDSASLVGYFCNRLRAAALATPRPPAEQPQDHRACLTAIMRAAEAAKEPCGMDPESPQAVRNGAFASIAAMAAQGLGLVSGPTFQAEQPAPLSDDVLRAAVQQYGPASDDEEAGFRDGWRARERAHSIGRAPLSDEQRLLIAHRIVGSDDVSIATAMRIIVETEHAYGIGQTRPVDEPVDVRCHHLLALADRIDHEGLWRWSPLDHDKLTAEQKDRMNVGVELRRYADLLGSKSWRIYPPRPFFAFRAGTLDAVYEMAKRDEARRGEKQG